MKNKFLLWCAKGAGVFLAHAIKNHVAPMVRDEVIPIVKEAAKEAIAAEIRAQIQKQSS